MRAGLVVAALCLAANAAQAQGSSTGSGSSSGSSSTVGTTGYSWIPGTQRGYVGVSLGRADYDTACGVGFGCDKPEVAVHLFSGGMLTEVLGLEIGYKHQGNADRAGGTTSAQGIDLNLVAMVPLQSVMLYAKGGTIYSRTRIRADVLSGAPTGKETGWGATGTLGAGFSFNNAWGVALEATRDRMRFAGQGRRNVDSVSVALTRRF